VNETIKVFHHMEKTTMWEIHEAAGCCVLCL